MKAVSVKSEKLLLRLSVLAAISAGILLLAGNMVLENRKWQIHIPISSNLKRENQPVTSTTGFEGIAGPSEVEIVITRKGFIPSTLTISKGQQVKWLNRDTTVHQIISGDSLPSLSETDPLSYNESFTYTFESPGEYAFFDASHPDVFKGLVIVK